MKRIESYILKSLSFYIKHYTSNKLNKILHWNCHGYRTNYEDIITLIREFFTTCFRLQETMLGDANFDSPSKYRNFREVPQATVPDQRLVTLVQMDILSQPFQLNTIYLL